MHVSTLWWCKHAPNVSRKKAYKKNCVPEFSILSALRNYLLLDLWFLAIDMNTCIITGGRIFKTFLEENNAIALGNCYLFTKNMFNMELKMILIVFIEFAYISHFWTLLQIWWITCNLSRWCLLQSISLWYCRVFLYQFNGEVSFLQALVVPEYWEALK